jgi:hypothetical protein
MKLLAKHKLRQHAIDAGGVTFIVIEHCASGGFKCKRNQNKNTEARPQQGIL